MLDRSDQSSHSLIKYADSMFRNRFLFMSFFTYIIYFLSDRYRQGETKAQSIAEDRRGKWPNESWHGKKTCIDVKMRQRLIFLASIILSTSIFLKELQNAMASFKDWDDDKKKLVETTLRLQIFEKVQLQTKYEIVRDERRDLKNQLVNYFTRPFYFYFYSS